MEKRVFKFGEASFAIILPKKWIDKNSINNSSLIYLNENEMGELVIASAQKPSSVKVIDSSSKTNPRLLGRWVGNLYIYISVYSRNLLSASTRLCILFHHILLFGGLFTEKLSGFLLVIVRISTSTSDPVVY